MITIQELLEDATYKRFFLSQPVLPHIPIQRPTPPWRVYIQLDAGGKWRTKDCWKYTDAFLLVKQYLKTCHDAAIQSRGVAFKPPYRKVKVTKNGKSVMVKGSNGEVSQMTRIVYWKPHIPADEGEHLWCPYCRRPTELKWFSRHHAFTGRTFDPGHQRCTICGASEMLMRGMR